MGKIKLLSDDIINQIAAGEIVESPSSALKEIIENAIDANASSIEVFIKNGGKSKIVVEDNGFGMSKEDLETCILRHATSKLTGNNLFDIRSYGFRGEAIPSIASISNFSIESNGYGLSVVFSEKSNIYESSVSNGTRVCIESIFDKLPVRIKFLRSDQVEFSKCSSIVENFALTQTNINFTLKTEKGTTLTFKESSLESRVKIIYGEEQLDKAVYFEETGSNMAIKGYLFHPSHCKHSLANAQCLFINNRIVKDKTVSIAAKIGYRNLIDSSRYPSVLLFIEIDPFFVDVNISPTKSAVKFRDTEEVQRFFISAITKHVEKFNKIALDFSLPDLKQKEEHTPQPNYHYAMPQTKTYRMSDYNSFANSHTSTPPTVFPSKQESTSPIIIEEKESFLGQAVAQLFENYIISVRNDTREIFIIDQHAVHEKITLNKMEKQLMDGGSKYLTRPEIINISSEQVVLLESHKSDLEKYGFKIDIIKPSNTIAKESIALVIEAIPGIMKNDEAMKFLIDISEDEEKTCSINDYFKERLGNLACHNSIRSGRSLSIYEMNELISQMENNKEIFQCNHHRPSFFKISKKQLEKMFERA